MRCSMFDFQFFLLGALRRAWTVPKSEEDEEHNEKNPPLFEIWEAVSSGVKSDSKVDSPTKNTRGGKTKGAEAESEMRKRGRH